VSHSHYYDTTTPNTAPLDFRVGYGREHSAEHLHILIDDPLPSWTAQAKGEHHLWGGLVTFS
jgi:hypothetical protein